MWWREKLLKYCRRLSFADPRMEKKTVHLQFTRKHIVLFSTSVYYWKNKIKNKINIRFATMLLIFVRRYYYWVWSLYIKLLALSEKYLNKTSALNVVGWFVNTSIKLSLKPSNIFTLQVYYIRNTIY